MYETISDCIFLNERDANEKQISNLLFYLGILFHHYFNGIYDNRYYRENNHIEATAVRVIIER